MLNQPFSHNGKLFVFLLYPQNAAWYQLVIFKYHCYQYLHTCFNILNSVFKKKSIFNLYKRRQQFFFFALARKRCVISNWNLYVLLPSMFTIFSRNYSSIEWYLHKCPLFVLPDPTHGHIYIYIYIYIYIFFKQSTIEI